MDGNLECQLWSTLFFSHSLDPSLHAARASSMIAMLSGLAAVAILTQSLPCRWANWICLLALLLWVVDSYVEYSRFNLWSTFFVITYVFFLSAARFARCHSSRRLVVRSLLVTALVSSVGIFFMLAGNVCSCSHLRQVLESGWNFSNSTLLDDDFVVDLAHRIDPDHCFDSCQPATMGPMLAPIFWSISLLLFQCSWEWKGNSEDDSEKQETTPSTVAVSEDEISTTNHIAINSETVADAFVVLPCLDSSEEIQINQTAIDNCPSLCTAESDLSDDVVEKVADKPQYLGANSGRLCYYVQIVVLSLLLVIYVFLVIVMVGAFVENSNAATAPDTSHNFVVDTVCAVNPLDPNETYVTFVNKRHATEAGYEVVHCGECARCSNPQDIETYVKTRKTVAKSAKRCSKTTIFGKYDELVDCLEEEIGFSRPCTECWADNMKSTAKYCLFTCLSSLLTGNSKANNLDHADDYNWLNQCIFCDEKRSGPAFVQCSGVARRRLGIQSEIERNPAEQCRAVDVDYVNTTAPNYFFNLYQ